MSILNTDNLDNVTESKLFPNSTGGYSLTVKGANASVSDYKPKDAEKTIRAMIIKHFGLGYVTMRKPRVELNDLSVIGRMTFDQMSFNTYQPNNGDPLEGDEVNAWKSKAIRPIVRNKCISIAAHATARLIFPKVFAQNEENDEDKDAATVMRELIEYATDQADYAKQALYRTISALTDPASIGYTEYSEVFRTVKREKVNGVWKTEDILDETLSGFKACHVPVNELFIENIYEPDIQKQGWLIWRKILSYSQAEIKYSKKFDNFKYVLPNIQTIYNDANDSFYQVYDPNMRGEMVEEIIYWNKGLDLKCILVNGVMLTDADNPNPRVDKLYPFDKYGYELINTRFFYYKSLAFKMQQDAKILNTLYPMIIDGTYLDVIPAMVATGGETIGSDVMIPGGVVTFTDLQSDLRPIGGNRNLKIGFDAMDKIESSLQETSSDPTESGQAQTGTQTAYEISRIEQNASIVLGLFIKMISDHVKQYGTLLVGDILQHLTIVDVDKIVGNSELVYKTFLLPEKSGKGARKIKFTADLPTGKLTKEQHLKESYKAMVENGGHESKNMLYKVNPQIFRKLKFRCLITPDVQNPMSDDLERAFKLEIYDRAINNPLADQEGIFKDFLLGAYPQTVKDSSKYIQKQSNNPVANMPGLDGLKPNQPNNNMPAAGNSPLNAMAGKQALPQTMGVGAVK